MIGWRGVDVFGDRFADLAEVREATGTAGAFSFDPADGTAEYVDVQPIGEAEAWGAGSSTATAYVDRGRVWLDGIVSLSAGSTAVGTLPTGKRPAATVYLAATFFNDIAGTPAAVVGSISITSAGVATLFSYDTPTGDLTVFLTGLSFKVAP